jgi:hypothetical protein
VISFSLKGRKLHIEELYNLYSSPNIIRVIKQYKMAGHVACMGDTGNSYTILVRKAGCLA